MSAHSFSKGDFGAESYEQLSALEDVKTPLSGDNGGKAHLNTTERNKRDFTTVEVVMDESAGMATAQLPSCLSFSTHPPPPLTPAHVQMNVLSASTALRLGRTAAACPACTRSTNTASTHTSRRRRTARSASGLSRAASKRQQARRTHQPDMVQPFLFFHGQHRQVSPAQASFQRSLPAACANHDVIAIIMTSANGATAQRRLSERYDWRIFSSLNLQLSFR